MTYRLMFTINAIFLAVFGALFLFAPELTLNQFRSDIYVATLFMARFFGSALILCALFLWMLKDAINTKMQKLVGYVLLAYSVIGFAATMTSSAVGVIRANGWVLLVVFGVFTLTYAYALFLQPKSASEGKSHAPRKVKDVPSANSG